MIDPTSTRVTPSTWMSFITAIQLLTRIQITRNIDCPVEYYNSALKKGVIFFPMIGGLIGVFTATIFVAASYVGLPPLSAVLLAIGLEAMLTGAFHEDALADSLDALGGGWTRNQVLEIMKDSRLGTYGTVGLILGIGLRVTSIATLLSVDLLWAFSSIVAASTLARLAIVGMMVTTDPISDRDSQARDISGGQTWRTFLIATLLSFPFFAIWIWLNPEAATVSLIVSMVLLIWFRRMVLLRIGGTTGDLLGCSAYLVQLVVLITSTGTYFHE